MAQIKAAFFDIDGTLLPFEATHLPASTVDALARLRKNGVKTFIATGRPPVHLPYLHALDGIPFDGYVTMNGRQLPDLSVPQPGDQGSHGTGHGVCQEVQRRPAAGNRPRL